MKIIITGSRGLIGRHLTKYLTEKGHTVLPLKRTGHVTDELAWDPENGWINKDALEGSDVVIHLSGENIAGKRWTKEYKAKIKNSRVKSTSYLAKNLASLNKPPHTLIVASAIGYFGDRGETLLDELSTPGKSEIANWVIEWEKASKPAKDAGIRVVNTRFGIVLAKDGGALQKMLPAFKLGFGAILGSGDQYMSWIDIDDLTRALEYIMNEKTIVGPIVVSSPNPITNYDFSKMLGKALNRPVFLKVPPFVLHLIFGKEMAEELLLSSNQVFPRDLLESGFTFAYPHLKDSLEHLICKSPIA